MTNVIDIRVVGKNDANLDKVGKDAKAAGKEIGDGLTKGFKEGEQAGDKARKKIGEDLDKTAKDAKDSGGKAGSGFGSAFGENLQGAVEGKAEDIVGGFLDQAKGAGGIAAAGAGIGGLLLAGIASGMERGNVGGLLAAQLEGTGGESARFGKIAGNVYADNFGDSIQDAADGIKAIIQNKLIDEHAADDSIRKLTGIAMTAAKVVDDTANNTARAARQLLVNGLASSATEAFDIIVASSQRGLNVNEDLIDTVVEYSTKFRDLGITGQEAMGLIGQAMDAGARDADTAADALKELAIRAQDGSEATARGFEALGLNAQAMGLEFAAGGAQAHEGLSKVLSGLRLIEDPVARNQAAVDLFGTKAEDLGDALFNMDLDTVASQFGDVAGATEHAGESMTTTGAKVEGFFRGLKQKATDSAGWLGSAFKSFAGGGSQDLMDLTTAAGNFGSALSDDGEQEKIRAREAAAAWSHEKDGIIKTSKTLAEHIQLQQDAAGVVIGIAEAEIRYQKSLDDTAEALKKNGKNLDVTTEKGRDNKQALLDQVDAAFRQIDAMEKQGSTTEEVRGFMEGSRQAFIDMATRMGMGADEANRMADKLRLIPGTYTANVVVDNAASNTIATIHGQLVNLTNRRWIASVAVTGTSMNGAGRYFAGLEHGGVAGASHAAEGGPRGNMTWVGEHGPELMDVPPGTMVHSNPDSMRMLSSMAGQGGGRVGIDVSFSGNTDSAFASAWMKLYDLGIIRIKER